MIGTYDFCGHYEWTFAWLEREGGVDLVRDFWKEAIGKDSQKHARDLIVPEGIEGMRSYWQHTLVEESAEFSFTSDHEKFRIDMHDCPSKGFLLRNGLEQYCDYCDHCIGWIGPMMQDAGFVVDHEHNHRGKCWWEFRAREDLTPPSEPGTFACERDVRLAEDWPQGQKDCFQRAIGDTDKQDDPA